LVTSAGRERFSIGDCGGLFGRYTRRRACEGLFKLVQRRWTRPRLQSAGFDRIQSHAQLSRLIERLAREDKRHDGNQQREKIER
jgi:hypothetical protein